MLNLAPGGLPPCWPLPHPLLPVRTRWSPVTELHRRYPAFAGLPCLCEGSIFVIPAGRSPGRLRPAVSRCACARCYESRHSGASSGLPDLGDPFGVIVLILRGRVLQMLWHLKEACGRGVPSQHVHHARLLIGRRTPKAAVWRDFMPGLVSNTDTPSEESAVSGRPMIAELRIVARKGL